MRTMRPVPQNVFENLPEEILVIVRVSYLYAYMYDYGGSRLWPSFRSGRTRKTDPAQLSYQYLTSIYGNGSARFTSCTAPLSCRSSPTDCICTAAHTCSSWKVTVLHRML